MTELATRHARLGDQLCFSLYAASRAVASAYRDPLAGIGLTFPQYLAMVALWEQDGRTVASLGTALDLESSTISPIIRRLEKLGFVSRRRSTDDERVVHVEVTPAGWNLETRAARVREAVEASTGLTDEQFASLRGALHTLRHTLKPPTAAGTRGSAPGADDRRESAAAGGP